MPKINEMLIARFEAGETPEEVHQKMMADPSNTWGTSWNYILQVHRKWRKEKERKGAVDRIPTLIKLIQEFLDQKMLVLVDSVVVGYGSSDKDVKDLAEFISERIG